jgi:uncharacterized protein
MNLSAPKTLPGNGQPAVVAALHLPDLAVARDTTMAFLEDYMLANLAVFAGAGVPSVMLQDQTGETGPASAATIAIMGALGRLARREFPQVDLGIIVRAHDAEAPLAVAHAAGASFVRLKVFVGAVMSMEGPKTGLGLAARTYRHALRRDDIAILADVLDRTSVPTPEVALEEAALGAEKLGADGLIITGRSFADSLDRLRRARAAGVSRPVLIGGGVSEHNVAESLAVADGVIVSTALMREQARSDLVQWDADKTRRFMDRVRRIGARTGG